MSTYIRYKHTQVGYLTIVVMVVMTAFFIFMPSQDEIEPIFYFILPAILILVGSFASLNVKIDETYMRIKFGYGIFRKKFLLRDIDSVERVKNHWYYGWGIRYWVNMWIFNVSGFDAIQIKMSNGRVYRIGTDDPRGLESALRRYTNISS